MILTVIYNLNNPDEVTLSFKKVNIKGHYLENLSEESIRRYQSTENLLKDACIDTTTNKILRKSYLEKHKPEVFNTKDYPRRELTQEEIEQYVHIRSVYVKKQLLGEIVEELTLAQWIDKNTEEYYKNEPEYQLFKEEREQRIRSNKYKLHDIRNSYHPDGGFKKLIKEVFGFEYSTHVSSEQLYKNYSLLVELKDNYLANNTENKKYIKIEREKDVVKNRDQYAPICYKTALVIILNPHYKEQFKLLLKNKKNELNFNKTILEQNFQKYNSPKDNSIAKVSIGMTSKPKKRTNLKTCKANSNPTPNKKQKFESHSQISKVIKVPTNTELKAPTNPTDHSIDNILEKKKHQPFIRYQ